MSDPHRDAVEQLRARLYAPGSTPADRVAYEQLLALAAQDDVEPQPGTTEAVSTPTIDRPQEPTRRGRRSIGLLLAAVALLVGGLAGFSLSERIAPRQAAVPSTTPMPAPTIPVIPTPLAGSAIAQSATQTSKGAEALAKALAIKDDGARLRALTAVDRENGIAGDREWSSANGCSSYTGTGNVARDGGPSGFETEAGETGSRPTGTRFRLKISLTHAADWSWIAYGTRTGDTSQVVALGAGAGAAGPAQYVDFAQQATTVITALKIVSSRQTPYLWQLEACTPD